MTDPNDKYLFLAYTLVWIVFMVYAWILSRRQSRLRIEINELKARKSAADGKG
ncbi:MAG TPA: CcmD family protein [Terriglobia bacterium]|nr:CcmD family protein [Terriglobia bacterium]